MVLRLIEIGLFDKELYKLHGVITSREVQRQFQEIIKGRGQKRIVRVIKEFWLLDESETAEYIGFSEKNKSFSVKNSIKEIKEKGNKNENKEKAKEKEPQQNAHEQAAAALIKEYEEYIGRASPNVIGGIYEYLGKGFEEELILRLIHYSCEQGKKSWQYLKAALQGNESAGVKTLSEYERVQAARNIAPKGKTRGICNYTDTNNANYNVLARERFDNLVTGYAEEGDTILGEEGAKDDDRTGD